MTNSEFWKSVNKIIDNRFDDKGLSKLEEYAERIITGQWLFKRFSPGEQHGCAKGGSSHVIATILSRAEDSTDTITEDLSEFKRKLKQGAKQAACIEAWAKKTGIWIDDINCKMASLFGEEIAEGGEAKVFDNGPLLFKTIGLDYFILPSIALDRISLHNAYFPETALEVVGFGRANNDEFKILVSQPFIEGQRMDEIEIETFMGKMGFTLQNRRNWTYITPEIYLSDVHDENVIKGRNGTIFVIDCDIRLNTPDLNKGGIRDDNNEIIIR